MTYLKKLAGIAIPAVALAAVIAPTAANAAPVADDSRVIVKQDFMGAEWMRKSTDVKVTCPSSFPEYAGDWDVVKNIYGELDPLIWVVNQPEKTKSGDGTADSPHQLMFRVHNFNFFKGYWKGAIQMTCKKQGA